MCLQILRSLQYRNLHMNDSVTDGLRTATISVQDTGNLNSGNITAYVNERARLHDQGDNYADNLQRSRDNWEKK